MLQVQRQHHQQQQNVECCTPVAGILHATGWVAPPFLSPLSPALWLADADDGQQLQFGL